MRFPMILAAGFAAISSVSVQAAEYIFTARIDQTGGYFASGTLITGRFGYDATIVPAQIFPADPGEVGYYPDPSVFLTAIIGGQSFGVTGGAAVVFNDADGDGDGLSVGGAGPDYYLDLSFFDPTGLTFSNVILPTGPLPALAQGPFPDANDDDGLAVPSGQLSLFYDGIDSFATVLTITPASAVPEPATWIMMIAGFGLIGSAMRNRRGSPMVLTADN